MSPEGAPRRQLNPKADPAKYVRIAQTAAEAPNR